MVRRRQPRGGQIWKTFINNHAPHIFAVDFPTQTTAFFAVVYIFMVMEIASRRIVLINATTHPSLGWVEQQLRQVTDWGRKPRFLSHDHDGIFGQYRGRRPRWQKARRYRSRLDLWLCEVMGIQGLPTPYGAPNANPHVERFHRTLRAEALHHFIFFTARHVLRLCREYARYYHWARPSQALHAIPDPYPELITPPAATGEVAALPALGGLIHDYRRAAKSLVARQPLRDQ